MSWAKEFQTFLTVELGFYRGVRGLSRAIVSRRFPDITDSQKLRPKTSTLAAQLHEVFRGERPMPVALAQEILGDALSRLPMVHKPSYSESELHFRFWNLRDLQSQEYRNRKIAANGSLPLLEFFPDAINTATSIHFNIVEADLRIKAFENRSFFHRFAEQVLAQHNLIMAPYVHEPKFVVLLPSMEKALEFVCLALRCSIAGMVGSGNYSKSDEEAETNPVDWSTFSEINFPRPEYVRRINFCIRWYDNILKYRWPDVVICQTLPELPMVRIESHEIVCHYIFTQSSSESPTKISSNYINQDLDLEIIAKTGTYLKWDELRLLALPRIWFTLTGIPRSQKEKESVVAKLISADVRGIELTEKYGELDRIIAAGTSTSAGFENKDLTPYHPNDLIQLWNIPEVSTSEKGLGDLDWPED